MIGTTAGGLSVDRAISVNNFNTAGTTTLGTSWQVIQNLAVADGTPVASVKPKEGATGWSDTWMVAKDTKSINCSYLWLDHVASPEVQAQIAEYFGEAPANAKA